MSEYSLVVRNARIVDGMGNPAFSGDLGVSGNRIAAVGRVAGRGAVEIDAEGKVLAPGFIDVHTHYDPQLCWDGLATPSPEHGVTSLIMGNCSVSLAPVRPEARDRLVGWFGSVEDMDSDLLRKNVAFDWVTVAEYLDTLRGKLGPNVGAFVGHAVIRAYVMGSAAQQRTATDEEIERMAAVLRESLAAGAFGLSFTYNHLDDVGGELPCHYADRRELAALLYEIAAADRMVEVAPDLRTGADPLRAFNLFGELSLETGARVTLSPILITDALDWRGMLGALEAWRAKGANIFAQTQVRPLDITMNLGLGTLLLGKTPLWRAFMDQSREGKIAMLTDPANRKVFVDETDEAGVLFGSLVVQNVVSPGNQKYVGRALNDIVADEGKRLGDVLIDIVLPDELHTEFVLVDLIHADLPRVAALLQHPGIHLGSADAGAHITAFSGAGDTCYLIEKFVRTEKAMSLETAVKRLTSDIARDWRIEDRGEIAVGKYADLVLFDPDTIARGPEQWVDDLPGGGGRYVRGATGISRVIVNGQLLVEEAAYTQAMPGMLL